VGSRGAGACIGLAVALAFAACTSSAPVRAENPDRITVASFDFAESELLAALYGGALEHRGFDVDLELGIGPREFVDPALARGLVDVVPEYAGTAVQFLRAPEAVDANDAAVTHRALVEAADRIGVTALAAAAAQDANAIVVSRATAERHDLATVSDLVPVAGQLVFGGPPECPQRPLCLQGLEATYDIHVGEFVALDVGGPVTLQALRTGDIDVGVLFTTDPALDDGDLVELRDDRGLQPAENITPLVVDDAIERHGPRLADALDAVSQRLTTPQLRELNQRVARQPERLRRIANDWLESEGLS
jgi:osmoprotectant transport system substrate-binding protein